MRDITALAFDPVNPSILYAGTPHLPWKTLDSGAHWQPIASGLIDDSDIFSIRVDPNHPQVVFASACSGIYRSENGGELWTKLRGIPGTHRRTHMIAQDPRDAETIFAGTTLGLFKSPDGGRSWLHLSTEQVNWMVFDPQNPRVLYLATEFAGIQKSTDSGQTFAAMNLGFANHSLTQITGSGDRLYASSIYEGRHGGVFRSVDGGLDWTLCSDEEALAGRNLTSLVAVPARKGGARQDLLFAASAEEILKSADGGKTWSKVVIQPKVSAGRPPQHFGRIRIQSLQVIQLDKLVLFAGTQSGLFRSADGGASWERLTPLESPACRCWPFTPLPAELRVWPSEPRAGCFSPRTWAEVGVWLRCRGVIITCMTWRCRGPRPTGPGGHFARAAGIRGWRSDLEADHRGRSGGDCKLGAISSGEERRGVLDSIRQSLPVARRRYIVAAVSE